MKEHCYHVSHMVNGNLLGHTVIRTDYDAMTPDGITKLIGELQGDNKSLILLSVTELKNKESGVLIDSEVLVAKVESEGERLYQQKGTLLPEDVIDMIREIALRQQEDG